MPEHFNLLTVLDDEGKEASTDLDTHQAEDLAMFILRTERAPRLRARERTPEKITAIETRCSEYRVSSEAFSAQLKRIATLKPERLAEIMAFIDLLEFGDGHLSGGNWMVEFIERLLRDVRQLGPAHALEQDPRQMLSDLAEDLGNFWGWMIDGIDLQKRHAALFPALTPAPQTTAVRPAAPEATRTPAKKRAKPLAAQTGKGGRRWLRSPQKPSSNPAVMFTLEMRERMHGVWRRRAGTWVSTTAWTIDLTHRRNTKRSIAT